MQSLPDRCQSVSSSPKSGAWALPNDTWVDFIRAESVGRLSMAQSLDKCRFRGRPNEAGRSACVRRSGRMWDRAWRRLWWIAFAACVWVSLSLCHYQNRDDQRRSTVSILSRGRCVYWIPSQHMYSALLFFFVLSSYYSQLPRWPKLLNGNAIGVSGIGGSNSQGVFCQVSQNPEETTDPGTADEQVHYRNLSSLPALPWKRMCFWALAVSAYQTILVLLDLSMNADSFLECLFSMWTRKAWTHCSICDDADGDAYS